MAVKKKYIWHINSAAQIKAAGTLARVVTTRGTSVMLKWIKGF